MDYPHVAIECQIATCRYLVRASETYILYCGDLRVLVAGRKITVRSPSVVDGSLVLWQHRCSCRQTKDLADTPERDVIVVADMLAGGWLDLRSGRFSINGNLLPRRNDLGRSLFSGVVETPPTLFPVFSTQRWETFH